MVITQEQRAAVSRAVVEAERRTSGEIVPVVAKQSGRYDRAEDLVGVCVALLSLTVVWFSFQGVEKTGGWSDRTVSTPGLFWIAVSVLVGFLAGASLAARIPALRRPFIARAQMREEVERSAAAAFHTYRVRRTQGATGILLYVALYERVVLVVGDDAIAETVSQDEWDHVRDAILDRVRAGDLGSGLIDGIRAAGDLLREHLPADDGDNELHNELRVV